jgi:2-C-methyl-D-erythritol 4-phosphate cytidylyltransferase
MSVIILVPAAGTGSRMGAAINKQYLTLADRPILAHTLHLFDGHPVVDGIHLISPLAEIDFCRREMVERYAFAKVRSIIAGGTERQDSVRNGLQNCGAEANDIVLVHDGARPFFSSALLPELVAITVRVGACVVGVPVKDTIKEVAGSLILGTLERGRLWQAQTPQAFRFDLICDAHEQAVRDGFRGTDDASLVERLGHPVAMLAGNYRNIKITTPEDLILAEAFLKFPANG